MYQRVRPEDPRGRQNHYARCQTRPAQLAARATPGIGPTTASALVASLGGGHDFKNGRQLAAWAGLVPGQYSSGGKARLGRITKAGMPTCAVCSSWVPDPYSPDSATSRIASSRWARNLVERRGYWKAAVAIAARTCGWQAVMHYGDDFRLAAE